MKRKRTLGTLLALASVILVAGCGGGDDGSAQAATTTRPDIDMTVRVTADKSGLSGCYASTEASGLTLGNDARLAVEDEAGQALGTGTMHLSPGLTPGVDTCDWTVEFGPVSAAADFYRVDAGGELVTVSNDELRGLGGLVTVNVGVDGAAGLVWTPTG